MEDGWSLGSLGLGLHPAEVGEGGAGILGDSVVWPRGELQVKHLPRFTTQLRGVKVQNIMHTFWCAM